MRLKSFQYKFIYFSCVEKVKDKTQLNILITGWNLEFIYVYITYTNY